MNEKIITGKPVPIENSSGTNEGLFVEMTKEINIPKNITPL